MALGVRTEVRKILRQQHQLSPLARCIQQRLLHHPQVAGYVILAIQLNDSRSYFVTQFADCGLIIHTRRLIEPRECVDE